MSSVASQYSLSDASSEEGGGFDERIRAAQAAVKRPTFAELLHVAVIGFDMAFGSFVVFGGVNPLNVALLGIGPGVILTMAMFMMASSRAKMVEQLGSRTEAEARKAVRGMIVILFIHIVLVAKDIGWWFAIDRMPKCPDHYPNDDIETNSSILHVANVTHCFENNPELFKEPLMETDLDAVFYSGVSNGEVWGHLNGHFAVVVYLMACSFLYYVAKAQGVLHQRLLDDWELERKHVLVLILWWFATLATLALASVSWAGAKDRRVTRLWGSKGMVSASPPRLASFS